jgi:hypothetical protein
MKPMLFSTPMVAAILNTKPDVWPAEPADRAKPFKWQTRRVIKPQPTWPEGRYRYDGLQNGVPAVELLDGGEPTEHYLECPKPLCEEGGIIRVRESWRCMGFDMDGQKMIVQYRDESCEWAMMGNIKRFNRFAICDAEWKPAIYMPREAARIFLEVKSVRVERLRDITGEDADAEGIRQGIIREVKRDYFHLLWDVLAKKSRSPHTWESNPWVFVYEFMPTTNEKERDK